MATLALITVTGSAARSRSTKPVPLLSLVASHSEAGCPPGERE
jgi:hypothetical protein